MHPIEHLRYVARSSGMPADTAVAETAAALRSFGADPVALVTAARRVVSRQPSCAPLWNLCAAMLCSNDPTAAASGFVAAMEADGTAAHLVRDLDADATVVICGWPVVTVRALVQRPDVVVLISDLAGEGEALAHQLRGRDHDVVDLPPHGIANAVAAADLVIVEALAVGAGRAVVAAGSVPLAAVASTTGVPVLGVAPMGTVLASSTWDALMARRPQGDEPWEDLEEILDLALVDRVVGPAGFGDPVTLDRREDGPVAAELHRPDIT